MSRKILTPTEHTGRMLEGYFAADAEDQLRQAAVSRRGPRKATEELRDEVWCVLGDFDGSMSTRQIYYQLVSRGAVENCGAAYDRVQRLLVQMRRDGDVAHERIVDRTRSKHHRRGWEGMGDVLDDVRRDYRRDLWAEQDVVPMVACEKQALEGIFAEVVDEYGAMLWVIRGFNSESFAWDWAREIKRQCDEGKRVAVSYFGDFDPSGLAIEVDAQNKLRRLDAEFTWQRRGLLWADFDDFDLVNVPVKRTDSRSARYLATFGDRAAELDALPPGELRARIRAALDEHIDREAWDRLKLAEDAERESFALVASNWQQAVRAVGGAA